VKMSADLFAEFGASSTSNTPSTQQQKQSTNSAATPFSLFDDFQAAPAPTPTGQQPIVPSNAQQDGDDNDEWGEFEGDTASFEPPPLQKQDSFAFVATAASRARAPTLPSTQENVGLCEQMTLKDMALTFYRVWLFLTLDGAVYRINAAESSHCESEEIRGS
jgi:hypothetical protein